MKRTSMLALSLVLGLSAVAAGCTEGKRARSATKFTDHPADITCWNYGTEVFNGRSTGTVDISENQVSFVDAATGRFTAISANCRVVYLAKGS